MKLLHASLLICLPILGGLALHASAAPNQAPQAALSPEHRHFDFWVGDWNVFGRDGSQVGTNKIELIEQGGGMLESWRNSSGGTGTSLSYYNRQDGRWYQVWVTGQGASVASGGLEGENMVLSGVAPDGKSVTSRTTWSPRDDGSVRQHWEQTADNGKTWSTVFDGIYERKEASDAPDTGDAAAK